MPERTPMSEYLKVRLTVPQARALSQAAGEILAHEGDGWTTAERVTLQRAHAALSADLTAVGADDDQPGDPS